MAASPQTESAFVSRLPREIRDAIYLELWRSNGLRQHIICYNPLNKPELGGTQFCTWPCSTAFQVHDKLQENIETLRQELGVPLGEIMWRNFSDMADTRTIGPSRALKSPWLNHWPCGENAYEKYGKYATFGMAVCDFVRKTNKENGVERGLVVSGTYLPLLLSCKTISAECLQSIYESTTFVFTDMTAIQLFFGQCQLPPGNANDRGQMFHITPPAFFQYARNLEISLTCEFPLHLWCAQSTIPIEQRHSVYDFHWLRLDKFKSLQNLRIWISSSSVSFRENGYVSFLGIKQLELQDLKRLVTHFRGIPSVILSTPLSSNIAPEEGFIENLSSVEVQIYKRGAGDRFWPFLNLINEGREGDGDIWTGSVRQVRVGWGGGHWSFMPDFRMPYSPELVHSTLPQAGSV